MKPVIEPSASSTGAPPASEVAPSSYRPSPRNAGKKPALLQIPPLLLTAIACKLLALVLWFFASSPKLAATLFLAPDPFVLHALFAPSAQGLCRTFTRFTTPRNELWLTIDDGPDPGDTPQILDLLDRHHARATFFVIGERAARFPELIAEILRRGHDVAHHTHTHPAWSLWRASPSRLAAELDDALAVLLRAGATPRWFRAPVGIKHLLLAPALAARGLAYVGWTVRSGDCRARTPEAVVASVLRRLRPGAIVLTHEGPSVSAAVRVRAIALLLEACTARGFRCVVPEQAQLQ